MVISAISSEQRDEEMTDPPRVSVVINTLNRAPYLRRLLGSLSHLDYPSFEVVVVSMSMGSFG